MPRCHLSRPGDRFFTHIAEKRPARGWRRAAHSIPGRPPGCWARRGGDDKGTKSQDLQPQPPTRSGKPVRNIPGNGGQPCRDGFPISDPPPQAGDCSCNGAVPFAKPPPGHTGAAGTNISFIFVSLILLVLTKGSSRVERVVEGAHAASTGAVCVEEKIKEKSDGWHAGSALSLSPSLSLSIYFPLCC